MNSDEKLKAIDKLSEHSRQIRIVLDNLYGNDWRDRYAARAIVLRYISERRMTQDELKDALLQLG